MTSSFIVIQNLWHVSSFEIAVVTTTCTTLQERDRCRNHIKQYLGNDMTSMTTATDRLRGHHDQDHHDQDHPIPVSGSVVVPHESHAHACTWMSYGASTKIWGRQRLVEAVKANLRTIAIAIAQQQEVVRVLVRPDEYQQAMKEFESDLQQQKEPILQQNIILIPIPSSINDIWIRDTGPIFVHRIADRTEHTTTVNSPPLLGAINGNFNGWGNKQQHDCDKHVAAFIVQYLNHNIRSDTGRTTPSVPSSIRSTAVQFIENRQMCLEGGGIEVDGNGTAIVVESCVLNQNRNQHWNDKDQCTRILRDLLGLTKIIWLPGILDPYDITDGHVDGLIRFVPIDHDNDSSIVVMACQEEDDENHKNYDPGSVHAQHVRILQNSTNARNGPIRMVKVPNPSLLSLKQMYKKHPDFCASYVNYYICNNRTVLLPQYHLSPYDENAIQIFKDTFPDTYTILPISIHTGIACGGGGIHCVTLHQPSLL